MKLRFAGCVYAAALLIGGATAALAQEKTFELKLSHWVPPSHPLQKALEEWGASVEKASGGTLQYKVYPAQQLGKAFDHYDMARDGIADLTYINPGYQPGRFPIIAAGELPFLISDAKGGTRGTRRLVSQIRGQGDEGRQVLPRLHPRPELVPFERKEDRGARRHQGHEDPPGARHHGATFVTLLGGTNVQLVRAGSARHHRERHVADAVTFPWGSLVLFGIDKVTKYHMDAPLYVTTFAFVFNKAKYDEMSPRRKRRSTTTAPPTRAARVGGPWGKFEDAGIDKVKAEPGQEVYKLTPEQTAEWKKAAEPLVKSWADGVKKAGVDPDAAMKELRADLAKYNALAK